MRYRKWQIWQLLDFVLKPPFCLFMRGNTFAFHLNALRWEVYQHLTVPGSSRQTRISGNAFFEPSLTVGLLKVRHFLPPSSARWVKVFAWICSYLLIRSPLLIWVTGCNLQHMFLTTTFRVLCTISRTIENAPWICLHCDQDYRVFSGASRGRTACNENNLTIGLQPILLQSALYTSPARISTATCIPSMVFM